MAKHGASDWSKYRPDSATFPIEDPAELAARLGSINTFDRRGDVIWMTSFENGLPRWNLTEEGDGATVTTSPTRTQNGGYSCQLITGSDEDQMAGIFLRLPYPSLSKFGIEYHFTLGLRTDLVTCHAWLFDGTTAHRYSTRYDNTNNKLEYRTTDAMWTPLASNIDLWAYTDLFLSWKLVVNLTNNEYTRLIINSTTYNLTTIAPWTYPCPLTPHLRFDLNFKGQSGYNVIHYLDDVIITQDEP